VLLWNNAKEKPSTHTKFEALWIRPYIVKKIPSFNSYMLKHMKGKMLMLLVNVKPLKGLFTCNFLVSLYIVLFYFVYYYC
jgi:hypothetical protein